MQSPARVRDCEEARGGENRFYDVYHATAMDFWPGFFTSLLVHKSDQKGTPSGIVSSATGRQG